MSTEGHLGMNTPPIVSPQEWEAAREQLTRLTEGKGVDSSPVHQVGRSGLEMVHQGRD